MSYQKIQYRVLDDANCKDIADAAYRILANTGCQIHNEKVLEILKQAGCQVEEQEQLVRIPEEISRKAVADAPSEITLYNREGQPAMELKPGAVYFGPAITIAAIEDLETGKRRPSVEQDSVNAVVLMDALDNISWVSPLTSPQDVDASVSDLIELKTVLANTNKPVMYWSQSLKNLKYQFEMFEAACSGQEQVQDKPFMINLICPMDPLTHSGDGMDQIVYLAERKSPIVYIAGIGMGLSGPATIAGTIAVGIADTLAGLIVAQIVNPGTPFVASKFTDNVDFRTMSVTHSNPEMLLANAATADVFRFMGLPFCSNFSGTDSGVFDQIAAFDKSIQIYTALLSETNMNFAMGAYESGAYAKLQDLVFGNEAIGFLKVLTGGVEVSEETLAEDVIDEVGPGGVFISEEHTLDHIHDFWIADLMKPRLSRQLASGGVISTADGITARVKEILQKGSGHPLSEEAIRKLDAIIEKAASAG